MPEAQAAAAPAAGQQRQQQGGAQGIISFVVRMAMMYYMMQWMKGGQQAGPAGTAPSTSNPLYRRGDLVDMYVYLSEEPFLSQRSEDALVWKEAEIALGLSPERSRNVTYHPSQAVQNNGSVYLHAFFVRSGLDIDTPAEDLPPNAIFTLSHNLIAYLPKPKNKTGVNLLDKNQTAAPQVVDNGPREYVSFLKPNATISIVDQFQAHPRNSLPPQLAGLYKYNEDGDHYPLMHWNEFWLLRDKYIPMNASVEEVQLALHVAPQNFWWMQMQQQMEASFKMQQNIGIANDGESDELKRVFLEGNPVLLAITMVVSMLHSVFDFLAFKNDVAFWKENKSMEGLSARSIMINAVCQAIIFLYLLDNDTSMVVLLSSGVGTAIEFWKVTKAFDVSIVPNFPYLSIKDKASYDRHDTKKHDADAIRMLSYALYPLVIGYSIYALLYETHKSWYSWVLGSLVGAVYTFGFILMCPQLYLNYKLKSVAHLPWRQMTYKFLNTIIDDLFAFVIKMPILHRLSVFRDDVIFCIFLYQRWIYRVDPTRVNEFGFSGVDAAAAANGEHGQQQLAAGEAAPLIEGSQSPGQPQEGPAGQQAGPRSKRQDAAAPRVPQADVAQEATDGSEEEDEAAAAASKRSSRRKKA